MDGNNRKGIVLAACLLALLPACSSELDKVRGEFIASCKSSGAPRSTCECAIDKLQEHYGEQGLVAIQEQGYPPSDFFERLAGAAQQCRGL